jgi:hypothetical protein
MVEFFADAFCADAPVGATSIAIDSPRPKTTAIAP